MNSIPMEQMPKPVYNAKFRMVTLFDEYGEEITRSVFAFGSADAMQNLANKWLRDNPGKAIQFSEVEGY